MKNKNKYFNVLGFMSGTSMDGIDISLVRTNGLNLINLKNYFFKYDKLIRNQLFSIVDIYQDILKNQNLHNRYNNFVTNIHLKALEASGFVSECELIGFHGQTIFHNSANKISLQLGNGQLMANETKKNVVFDFRKNDLKNGGEGAPLAPIYHKLLIKKQDAILPCVFLNIGGISNVTYFDNNQLIGMDTGPGNVLLDDYIKSKLNKEFDKRGKISSKGKINYNLLNNFLNNEYFKLPPPKSLDRNFFQPFLSELLTNSFSVEDNLATLTELTTQTIIESWKHFPQRVNTLIVSGGGSKNEFLISRLKYKLKKIVKQFQIYENHEFVESEMIAFLACRSILSYPITFPKTTGVKKPLSGGTIYRPL